MAAQSAPLAALVATKSTLHLIPIHTPKRSCLGITTRLATVYTQCQSAAGQIGGGALGADGFGLSCAAHCWTGLLPLTAAAFQEPRDARVAGGRVGTAAAAATAKD